jgi:serine/threonine-protein kinase
MSPEQAKGKTADRRADIWAFGAVVWEMLAGRTMFAGETTSETMAQVMIKDPDWDALPGNTPPRLRDLLHRCLVKDPRNRVRDVGDVRIAIEEMMAHPAALDSNVDGTQPKLAGRKRLLAGIGIGIAAGIVLAAIVAWTVAGFSPSRPSQPARFVIIPPPAQPLAIQGADRDIAISPDGSRIVYRVVQDQLAVRSLDQLDACVLTGIMGVRDPFMSPDGRWVGFFAQTALRKVSISGGPPVTLCGFTAAPRGATWGADGTIIFATADPATGLLSVPAGGGEPKILTKPDRQQGEADHVFPFVLPGGRGVLFTIIAAGQPIENAQVAVLDLKTGQRKILLRGGTQAEYVDTGHIVYAVAGTLRAVRFDLARLEVLSDPVPVVEQVLTFGSGAANFAISRTGALVSVPGGAAGGSEAQRSLVWVNRQGQEEHINAPPRAYTYPRLSPDGTRVALDIRDQENDIWIWDLMRQTLARLTSDPGPDQFPVWTPDSRRVIFSSQRQAGSGLYWQAADNTGTSSV